MKKEASEKSYAHTWRVGNWPGRSSWASFGQHFCMKESIQLSNCIIDHKIHKTIIGNGNQVHIPGKPGIWQEGLGKKGSFLYCVH